MPYRNLRRPLDHVGSLLDAAALHPGRSGRNHLLWLAHAQGLAVRRVDHALDLVGLASVARRKAGGYSLGMRRRLGSAAALLGDPPIIMLDEPFNGMDPDGIIWMRRFLRSLAAQGRGGGVQQGEGVGPSPGAVCLDCSRPVPGPGRREKSTAGEVPLAGSFPSVSSRTG